MKKYEHIFDTSKLQSDLKRRSLRSGALTIGSQAIQFIIQLGSTMILARILSPQDYGINAMAMTITGFAGMFSSFGLATATIQRADINHEQVSTLFWINVLIGVLITAVTAAISPAVAWFYNTPEMLKVMLTLSVIFTIIGLSVQHQALLTRQMNFFSIISVNVVSMLAGIIVAMIAGYYGFGYWALVFNVLINVTINALGYWICCRWLPGLPRIDSGVIDMIRFGSNLVGSTIVSYFPRNLDNVLIGRYHGSDALGLYSKAYQLLMMPITNLRHPMARVAIPSLSRLQNNPEQYGNYYLKCVSLLAFLSMPMVAFLFVCSDHLIDLILGSQWTGASEIFKILALAAFIQPVISTYEMILISSGKGKLYLTLSVVTALVVCVSFVAGLPWGPIGVAASYAAANYLIAIPTLYYTFKNTSITIRKLIWAIYRPFCSSLMMAVGYFLIQPLMSDMPTIFSLVIGFFISSTLYIIIFVTLPGGIAEILESYSYVKLILKRS